MNGVPFFLGRQTAVLPTDDPERRDTRLVLTHEASVADHVSGKDGCEAALHNVLPSKEE